MEPLPARTLTGQAGIGAYARPQAWAGAAFASALALRGLAGLDLPKEPLKILPFFDFLSPLPMSVDFSCESRR